MCPADDSPLWGITVDRLIVRMGPEPRPCHLDYGLWLPLYPALAKHREAVQLDPDNANAQNDLAVAELDVGETSQALAPGLALICLDPHSAASAFQLALTYALPHRDADATNAFHLAQPGTPLSKSLIAAGRLAYQSLLVPNLRTQALAAVGALRKWPDFDPESTAGVLQLELALGQDRIVLKQLPKFCASLAVASSDLGVNPVWLSLRGQPRFQALVKQYDTLSRPVPSASARLQERAIRAPAVCS